MRSRHNVGEETRPIASFLCLTLQAATTLWVKLHCEMGAATASLVALAVFPHDGHHSFGKG